MRADRLLTLMLLLQSRGRMTAKALSRELGVSIRTVYRDIDALDIAGIPIWAERGPGGGVELMDTYRTSLTGLTDSEVQALFMLSIPTPFDDLGLRDVLQSALLKVIASSRRSPAVDVGQRVYIDPQAETRQTTQIPHFKTVQRAVWDDQMLEIVYSVPFLPGDTITTIIAPYGLVAKGGEWFLVGARGDTPRVYRLADIINVQLIGESFTRKEDFNIGSFWQNWRERQEANQPVFPVTIRARSSLVPYLPFEAITAMDSTDSDDWITVEICFENFIEARTRLLGLGGAVEVLEPQALRLSIADFAAQIASVYR
jgi:predicted DNA-binding transcriptional regulator YafY